MIIKAVGRRSAQGNASRFSQLATYPGNIGFAPVQGVRVGVNGVISEHEVVGMLDGRAQDEGCIVLRLEFYRAARFLEDCEFAFGYLFRSGHETLVDGDPGNGVIVRRLIAPVFSSLKADIEIGQGFRRGDLADGVAVTAEDDAGRS